MRRVVCINLDRRPDRWEKFLAALPADWPFGDVERYPAVDGQLCKPPAWWRQGPGAWGCYRTHVRIIEECLNAGVESVLILEDDALCCGQFAENCAAAMADLPGDWGMFYLGGQHIAQKKGKPTTLTSRIARPFNVNRTHAYALRGETMRAVYQHLCVTDRHAHDGVRWNRGNHIDHHYGRGHMARKWPVYAANPWLIGQMEGKSNINGRDMATRFWNGEQVRPVVAILGPHRSGSSCLAGVVANLGLYMGDRFVGCEADGGHEAAELARICEAAMRFPGANLRPYGLESKLRRFIESLRRRARGKPVALKYPHLCVMGDALEKAAQGALRVVSIDRPLDESIRSLVHRSGKRHDYAKLAAVQRMLHAEREKFLRRTSAPVLHVEYDRLIGETEAVVAELAAFIGVAPTAEAVAYVDGGKRRFKGEAVGTA